MHKLRQLKLLHTASHAYLAFAGLGRWCWSFNNINWRGLLKNRWAPFTHSEMVHYCRAARLFTEVEVATTLIWWDDKMAYFEHRLMQGDRVSAMVLSRGTFFAGRERISPCSCAIGLPAVTPMVKPEIVQIWSAADGYVQQAVLPATNPPPASQ